jgi:hypothetical protein
LSSFQGLQQQEGFALANSSGGKSMFKIATNNANGTQGILPGGTTFTCDSSTPCVNLKLTFPTTLYVGDYLPDTIPFAQLHHANTIEVYFCDWEFAYNNTRSTSLGCQASDTSNGNAYATILNNP